MAGKLRLVCATRASKDRFVAETLLGRSMALLKSVRPMEVRVFPENAAALPAV